MRIEVVYAWPGGLDACRVELAAGATLRQAIAASGLLARHPEIDLRRQKCGVFGKLRALDAALREGERVEIYRGLAVDPKEARRRRARKR
ncbi:MAG TPA: RnfH family protein [Burkholderiales bacterium]|nr:RnfH family protein [Burkholderiales bacterium]